MNKELQRVNRSAMQQLGEKDVIFAFPVISEKNKTQLVLKKSKTLSSIRKVFLPSTGAKMLVIRKEEQDELKEALGSEYSDYDLVFAGDYGMPTEASTVTESFKKLINERDLPPVVFHSLRHSSITYKLKLNGVDIKAVQAIPVMLRPRWSRTSTRISWMMTGSRMQSSLKRHFTGRISSGRIRENIYRRSKQKQEPP